jgi:hypothetical protein
MVEELVGAAFAALLGFRRILKSPRQSLPRAAGGLQIARPCANSRSSWRPRRAPSVPNV